MIRINPARFIPATLIIITFLNGTKTPVFNIVPTPALSSPSHAVRSAASLSPHFIGQNKEPDFLITAKNVLVSDIKTNQPLFTRRADELVPVASLTKLMTALVLLDRGINFDDEVRIFTNDLRGGVPELLIPGEKVQVRDLWNLMLVASYNTAAAALVRHIGFSEDEFVRLMRDKANDLFLFEIEFADATGLSPANRASARNITKLTRAAFGRFEIIKAASLTNYEFATESFKNTKRLVTAQSTNLLLAVPLTDNDFEIVSGKTGYLDESKYNFVLQARQGDHDIIMTLLGSESKESRFEEAKNLADWIFNNYKW